MNQTVEKWGLALFFLVGTTILLKAYALYVPYGIRFVYTASMPQGLYQSKTYDQTPLTRGQAVCVHTQPTGWVLARHYLVPGEIVCKYTLGVPGDIVEPRGDEIRICHEGQCTSAGIVQKTDINGQPSFPAFSGPTVIPAGSYYFGSTHNPRSLDSRYLGLIGAEHVTVRIWPVWNF